MNINSYLVILKFLKSSFKNINDNNAKIKNIKLDKPFIIREKLKNNIKRIPIILI